MALNANEEEKVRQLLTAFESGKRINQLDAATGSLSDMQVAVMDESGETRRMNLQEAVQTAGNPIAGRWWDETAATPTAAGYYGSLQALKELPAKLGLGRYLVTDDRKRRKLDAADSTRFDDGSPAKLDGTMGQCMWCWNAHYFTTWTEGNRRILTVTFQPIKGKNSIYIPAGGISWIDAGVMDRTEQKLCSVISTDPRYRGGNGNALGDNYPLPLATDAPQKTMLGMPATALSTTAFGTNARKRGEGWEANWFVARAVVEYLFEIIMGTRNSQAAFNAELDSDGLRQGGFGTGVTNINSTMWNEYNGYYPLIPTSVGLEMGDGVGLVDYSMMNADGVAVYQCKVPVFFGLVNAGFGNLWRWVRGLIMSAGDISEVYVSKSMYADFDPNSVDGMLKVAECPQQEGWIKKKSYEGLCCMPTSVGASNSTCFCDYFYTNAATSKGLRVRAAGGSANNGTNAGASYTTAYHAASTTSAYYSSPLCFFEEDPQIG
ncbi:MAG: hypothetical protein NC080_04560 [Paraprevotella sp.]|nr:hypothetical protein [Paraprevotella sp.]